MRKEVWKYIPGLGFRYQVSNFGRMRIGKEHYRTTKAFQILSIKRDKHGYFCCDIYDGRGKFKRLRVHRLVLFAFRGLPKYKQEGRHLNDIKTDNQLSNLKWGTRGENCKDFYRNGGIRGFNNPKVLQKCFKSRGLV